MDPEKLSPDANRLAEKIDSALVIPEIEHLGYTIVEAAQPWRHGGFHLEKEGHEYFLKMASTEAIGARTTNEIAWNTALHPLLNEETDAPCVIPPIYKSGTLAGKVYYVTDYYTPEALEDIPQLARICAHLRTLPHISLPRDAAAHGSLDFEAYTQKARTWMAKVAEDEKNSVLVTSLTTLLEEKSIPEIERYYRPALAHGDFAPGHILKGMTKPILIDGEAGTALAPDFYDAAYFYHLLWTKSGRPDVAEAFKTAFFAELSEEDQEVAHHLFPANLAYRTIGGIHDWISKDGSEFTYHQQLIESLL